MSEVDKKKKKKSKKEKGEKKAVAGTVIKPEEVAPTLNCSEWPLLLKVLPRM
jgi:hypothetical protein